ncbi:MAG: efflux RND transporter periplasmic adaptor subunit [Oscillospiraceae bacterium]
MKKIAFLLALIAAVSACGCSSKKDGQEIVVPIYESDKVDYKTEEAVIGDISQKYYIDGEFGYPYLENVTFKISGRIESIEVEENDSVEKGDLLCVLDSEELDRKLEEKQVYVDQAQKTVNTLLSEGGSATEIELAKTQLEVVMLEYDHLAASLEDYSVYAPCSGVFRPDKETAFGKDIADQKGAKNIVIEGAEVKSGQSLGTISDHSQSYLICEVYDNPLENVNFGTRVSLEQGVSKAGGKVVDVINNDVGGMKIYTYVILPDEDADLGDMGVKCCFEVYSKLDTVLVPTEAVKKTKSRTYVNLLIDGTKIEQDVETGIEDGDKTEIISGLSGGEQVIIT